VLAIVAHDLRNPLNAIVMNANLVRIVSADAECAKAGEGIARAATRMNRLIQDLLDVAMIETERISIDPARIVVE
jgi:signal transduction histidine kinase